MGLRVDGAVDCHLSIGTAAEFKIIGDITWAGRVQIQTGNANNDIVVALEQSNLETEQSNSMFYMDIQSAGSTPDLRYIHEYSTGLNETTTFNMNLTLDTWHNIIVRRDVTANTVEAWLNTSPLTTFNYTNDPTSTATTVSYTLGSRSGGTGSCPSSFAEVGLWNRKLTDDEIAILNKEYSPLFIPNGLVSYVDCIRDLKDYFRKGSPALNPGSGSITVIDHPRVIYPSSTVIVVNDAGVTLTQLRPNADTSIGSWTTHTGSTSNLFQTIDETVADDNDFIQSETNPSSSIARFALTDTGNPSINTNHTLRYRYYKTGTQTVNLVVRLKEGTTVIASNTHNNIGTTVTAGSLYHCRPRHFPQSLV